MAKIKIWNISSFGKNMRQPKLTYTAGISVNYYKLFCQYIIKLKICIAKIKHMCVCVCVSNTNPCLCLPKDIY